MEHIKINSFRHFVSFSFGRWGNTRMKFSDALNNSWRSFERHRTDLRLIVYSSFFLFFLAIKSERRVLKANRPISNEVIKDKLQPKQIYYSLDFGYCAIHWEKTAIAGRKNEKRNGKNIIYVIACDMSEHALKSLKSCENKIPICSIGQIQLDYFLSKWNIKVNLKRCCLSRCLNSYIFTYLNYSGTVIANVFSLLIFFSSFFQRIVGY